MFIGIVGSRRYPALARVSAYVAAIAKKYPNATIISGGADGVDKAAEQAALDCGLRFISHRPIKVGGTIRIATFDSAHSLLTPWSIDEQVWATWRDAYFARNEWIARESDVLVAFPVDSPGGTTNTLNHAKRLGKRTFIYGGQQ